MKSRIKENYSRHFQNVSNRIIADKKVVLIEFKSIFYFVIKTW